MTQQYVDFRNNCLNHYSQVIHPNECISWGHSPLWQTTPKQAASFSLNTSSFTHASDLNNTKKV